MAFFPTIVHIRKKAAERLEATRPTALVERFKMIAYPPDVVHEDSDTPVPEQPGGSSQTEDGGDAAARFFSIIPRQ